MAILAKPAPGHSSSAKLRTIKINLTTVFSEYLNYSSQIQLSKFTLKENYSYLIHHPYDAEILEQYSLFYKNPLYFLKLIPLRK